MLLRLFTVAYSTIHYSYMYGFAKPQKLKLNSKFSAFGSIALLETLKGEPWGCN